jgi:fatty-acyl-CoA synthase
MVRAVLIDRLFGEQRPVLVSNAQVRAVEATPFHERVDAASTFDALRIGAARDPQAPAIQFLPNADPAQPALVISHAQFLARVTQAANLFASLGVGRDDVVSFLLPLVPQSFYALFGAEAAGIANPVNALLEPHQLAEILQAANTRVLVALGPTPGTDIWDKVKRIRALVPSLKTILRVGDPGARPADEAGGIYSFDQMLADFPGDRFTSGRRICRTDIAAYFHTGGTTGTPKLVPHTHENQVYQAWVINTMLTLQPGRPTLFGLPLYHVGGALTQALAGLAAGGSLVVLSPSGWRNPAAIRNVWQLVERFRPPLFGAVPTVLAAAAGVPVNGADTSSIRVISGGGSAIPAAVGRTLHERFQVPVLEVYGMTETSSVLTLSYADRPVRLGSAGHAVPYSRVRVVKVDAQGHLLGECAVQEIGVIAMSGPGVFSGYLNPSHDEGAFVEPGWVNSGDLGRLDEDGYLWITGRAKDLIIRGAHNIDPMPVEDVFYRHPDVALVAIVGQPDAYAGEVPLAYVQLKPAARASAADLLAHVRDHAPERAAVPVAVILIDAIPLTGVGKVFKPQLRWDAARKVFAETLAPLLAEGLRVTVAVGAHGTHGTLASITLTRLSGGNPEPAERERCEKLVQARLDPFVMRHQIDWAD